MRKRSRLIIMASTPGAFIRWHHPGRAMNAVFQLLNSLRQLRLARLLRRACGADLPGWALAEVSFSPAQADWLLRTLCGWHAQAWRADAPVPAGPMPLAALRQGLARRHIQLRACRLADPRALARGDVVLLTPAAMQRLFGPDVERGDGLALVIECGSESLRLRPAGGAAALSCRSADLHGALVGWVLRSRVEPNPQPPRLDAAMPAAV
jgi:hypothetical protein